MSSRGLLWKLLVCWLLLLCGSAGRAAPGAGEVISNTAYATFVDTASSMSVRLTSGTVNTRVAALEALALGGAQNLLVATGAPYAIAHTLANTGNTTSIVRIAVVGEAGYDFIPNTLQVIHDVNGNGVADAGEPLVPAAGIELAMGARVSLIVTGQVPNTASAGQRAELMLTAVTVGQGARAENTDTLTLTGGAAVQITLAASTAAATPAAPVTWTATAVNTGASPAGAMAVSVDGKTSNVFLLRVPVPANALYEWAGVATNTGSRVVYHLAGSPAASYVSAVPQGAVVDAVGWTLAELPAGGSLQGQFRVMVHGNAAGSISDTAYVDWTDQGRVLLAASNTVVLPLPGRPAQIGFFTSNAYGKTAVQNTPGRALYVQADAAMCNGNAVLPETVPVTVTSQLTGDVETYTAVETGPNTGLFRILPDVPTANAATHVVAAGDGVLEVLRNDLVTASMAACGGVSASAQTTLLIDPSGVVYDSRSNQPLAGATVQLIDVTGAGNGGRAGQPAAVLELDGATSAPSSIVTGADGVYLFPLVQPSTYQLRVTPPPGFVFPSKLPAALQPAGRLIDAPGSFGGSFVVSTGAVRFDVPLDTGGNTGLFVEKTASKNTAEVGDFVDYSVKLNNTLPVALPRVELRDTLPAGFAYVRGSARLEGQPLEDPVGAAGSQLVFSLGTVAARAQPQVTYRVRIGAGSQGGNGVNTVQAFGGGMASNRATARVQLVGGVFSSDAYVIGKVYADCRRDGVQSGDEPGIPGVRIYLEDGTYAVTDEAGKYSFYGLSPRTHVAKVDRTTLPAGATLVVLDNRNAQDAGSRFVDLKNGELHKADFAIAECDAGLREQIAIRRKALTQPTEIMQAAGVLLSPTAQSSGSDARALPASGALGLPGATTRPQAGADGVLPQAPALGAVADAGGPVGRNQQGQARPIATSAAALLPSQSTAAGSLAVPPAAPPAPAPELKPLEELLPQLTPETGFVGLEEGQVMTSLQTRVRVKGPLGAAFELRVNGQAVPATQVGKKSSLEEKRIAGWEYIGVDLKPGRNTVAVKVTDPFGNVRGQSQVTILAPGALATIRIDAPQRPVADPETAVAVTFALQDANGLPVTARTQLTLATAAGTWQTPDVDPNQPGLQVMVEGGAGRFLLLPPAQPGKVELAVVGGNVKAAVDVEFMPKLRPLLAAGIVEGTINLRNLGGGALRPAQSGDVFEREIQAASRSLDGGKAAVAARTALFLKGKVLGSSLLTLAYDSDKPADTRLFRDIQPNQFYPVYGDSSARGFDGQSTGRLYVLLQNGSNYALVGDFATQSDNPARQLTQYARALNGAKGRWSDGKVGVEAFASRTSATQAVQEFRANGTSGPFQLDVNGVLNSEQVHVITRSREQPALVLNDTVLAPFADYAIDPASGLLLLKAPVPSVDANLNPVFVRIAYDVDSGGPKHDVQGVEATLQVTPGVTVGAVAVRDEDPANRQRLAGLTLTGRLAEKTVVTAEVARSETDLQGTGNGQRVEFRHEGAALQAHVWGVHTDTGFANANSPQTAGQSQYGAKIGYAVNATNRVVAEALKTTSGITGAQQVGAELRLEHSLPGNMLLEVGVRHSSSNEQAALSTVAAPGTLGTGGETLLDAATATASTAKTANTTARVKLTAPIPGVPQADAYALAEQSIDGEGREVGVGANYAVNANTKVYVRHDFINSLDGAYTLNADASRYTSVAGVNTVLPDNTQLFNEYRMGSAVDGRTAEAALGLRKTVQLFSGFNASASLQRIKPLKGPAGDDSTAVALGAEYTASADWRASGQLQWQTSSTSRSWLASGAVVNKLDDEWTLLNRVLYNQQTSTGASGGERELLTAQSGLAFRPANDDRWNALGRVEYKRDRDSTVAAARDLSSWLFSTHANVQPNSAWIVSGRYAAKWLRDDANGLSTSSFTQLVGARSTWDLTDHWSIGLQGYRMWGDGAAETALGVEVGYLAMKNLWVAAGYNFKGFAASDLGGDASTQRGAYLRLRYKFDEELFDGRTRANAAAAPAATVQ